MKNKCKGCKHLSFILVERPHTPYAMDYCLLHKDLAMYFDKKDCMEVDKGDACQKSQKGHAGNK